jgi:hypothetical protein
MGIVGAIKVQATSDVVLAVKKIEVVAGHDVPLTNWYIREYLTYPLPRCYPVAELGLRDGKRSSPRGSQRHCRVGELRASVRFRRHPLDRFQP